MAYFSATRMMALVGKGKSWDPRRENKEENLVPGTLLLFLACQNLS